MSELAEVDPSTIPSKNDVSVLLHGKRLEIMANVDAKGLETLREMLKIYAEILSIISHSGETRQDGRSNE